jgi:thiol:disulfide interchange protein DsbD
VYVAAVASPQGSAEASNGISSRESGSDISWESYSKQRIAQLINNKESFVIDFTAAWCLVCQVNESRVFKSEEVQRLVHEKGVKLIKADWTSKDAEITEALSQYGRNSVPFVVVYNGGAAPKQFESLISVNEFVNALQHM